MPTLTIIAAEGGRNQGRERSPGDPNLPEVFECAPLEAVLAQPIYGSPGERSLPLTPVADAADQMFRRR